MLVDPSKAASSIEILLQIFGCLETTAGVTPAAESHGLWPWMNAPALGRDVAPLGRSLGATGFPVGLH
jgi:hypothetical protein